MEFTSKDKHEKLANMEIGGGSDQDLVIDFFRYMGRYHGRFLYYCTSGTISLIRDEKSNDQILEEMHIWRIEEKNDS